MRKILIISSLIFAILLGTLNISYAAVTVAEEALQSSFNNLIKELSQVSTPIMPTSISIDSQTKKIELLSDEDTYCIDYDLSNKPTFSSEILFEEGMSYDKFGRLGNAITILPFYAYVATVMSLDISYQDTTFYLLDCILSNPMSFNTSSGIIPNFEDGVINHLNAIRPYESINYNDSQFFNTFTLAIEKENLSPTAIKFKSTIIISPEADFSQIIGYTDKMFEDNTSNTPNIIPEVLPENVLIIPPSKTRYKVGEKLNLDGLKITAVYKNNIIKEIKDGYTVTGYNKNKEGKQTLTISYKGFSRSYDVIVGTNTYDVESEGKLPQTGNFSYLKDALYLLISILSIALVCIIYKSFKYSKTKK